MKESRQKWKDASLTDKIMAFATCVIAVATIAYTIISSIQITKLSEQITLSKRQTAIAEGSLDISQKILGANDKAIKLDQRPYIVITDNITADSVHLDLTKKNSFFIRLKNIGKSTAKKVLTRSIVRKMVAGKSVEQNNDAIEKVFNEVQRIKPKNPQDIPPGVEIKTVDNAYTTIDSFSAEDIAEVKREKIGIVFTGIVTYYDIFRIKHGIEFCLLYSGDNINTVYCAKHNRNIN